MKNNIAALTAGIARATEFLEKYGVALDECQRAYLSISDDRATVFAWRQDAAVLGEALGKFGWVRKMNYNGTQFDWIREVDGVKIVISDAEDCDMNGSPVPEKAFPIMIKNEEEK